MGPQVGFKLNYQGRLFGVALQVRTLWGSFGFRGVALSDSILWGSGGFVQTSQPLNLNSKHPGFAQRMTTFAETRLRDVVLTKLSCALIMARACLQFEPTCRFHAFRISQKEGLVCN